jgi:hypothetical protein
VAALDAAQQGVAAVGACAPLLNAKAFGGLCMHANVFPVVIGLLALAGCSSGVSVTVRNESSTRVHDVRVDGRCFAETIGDLAAGASRTVHVKPCGESGIRTKFKTGSLAHETPELGYIENSSLYVATLVIQPDLKVRDDIHLRSVMSCRTSR